MLANPTTRRLTICGIPELGAFQNAAVTHVLSILDPNHPSRPISPPTVRTSA